MTSTRSTIPAPPPNGVSSTWPPLSGVWSRGLSARSSWPPASALRDVALGAEPLEPLREQRDDVELHVSPPPSAPTPARFAQERDVDVDDLRLHVDAPDRVADQRDEQARRRPRRHLEHLARRQRDQPRDARRARARRRRRGSPRGPRPTTRPPPARGARRAARAARGRAAPRPPRGCRRRPGAGSAARRCRRGGRSRVASPARTTAPSASSAGARLVHVEGAVEPVRAADAAAGEPVLRGAGHVSRRCRRARGGSPCTAAALTTVRSALAVRPPRPMTLP